MIIAVPQEIAPGETRVAATPDTVKKYIAWGIPVQVQSGAGLKAGFDDRAYREAGAEIKPDAAAVCQNASLIIKINAPLPQEDAYYHSGQIIVANFKTLTHPARIKDFAHRGLTCLALDMLPRISRAQSMDILSSQNNLAGYKAVIDAVNLLPKAVPLMMTAAGTVTPARVLILGAGVAGLQAIATAKRLGAVVYASDVRPNVKEQVESLGGRFLDVKNDEHFEAASGYATETSAAYQKMQQEAVTAQLNRTDIIIGTALVPGKTAPRLINKCMLGKLPRGAVVIDMAAASGGNIEGSVDGETIDVEGVTLIGASDLAATLPYSASLLFANNIYHFLSPQYQSDKRQIVFNFEDELINKTCIARNGKVLI